MANFRSLTVQSGTVKQIQDADSIIVGSGILTSSGNLTITPTGTDISIAANKNIVAASGTGALDFSAGSGIFKTSTGAVTIGNGSVTVSGASTFSAAGTALSVTNNASVGGTLTGTGAIFANGGVDRSTAATLSLGTTNANAISIGSVGVMTTVLGNLTVNGTETFIGISTFQNSATFEGDVTFGNAVTDTVAFLSRAGPSGNPHLHFVKELAHTIDIDASTTAATAGGALSLLSGAGNGAAGGALSLDSGTGTAGGALSVGTTNAASLALGRSGITTTITGGLSQLTGALSLAGNAASSLTTSAGALTLTSAVAATWSTTAGALTVNGTGGINLQGGATTAAIVNSTGTAITIQAGATLAATGTGNINLPNNASARFQIEGSAVTSTVTSANLTTLTNGSNADALHVHAAGVATTVSFTATSGGDIDAGELVVMDDSGGSPRVFRADANGAGELANAFGVANNTVVGAGNSVTVLVTGERAVPDAQFDALPATSDVGKPLFLSTTAGNWTLTAPSGTGETVQRCGYVTVGGTGAVKVNLLFGDGIIL